MTGMRIGRRTAWWSLLAMVFIVPIAMSEFALPGIQGRMVFSNIELVKLSLIIMLALVALAAWAADLLRNGGKVRHSPISWLVLAWLVWVGITSITSLHWPTALLGTQGRYEGFVTFATYALIYFLALQFLEEEGHVLQLARVLLCSSVIVAVYGLLTYAGVGSVAEYYSSLPGEPAIRVFSSLGNPNVLGGFLIFAIGVSVVLALLERKRILRLSYWGATGLNALTLVVTFSRGAWLGAAVTVMLLAAIVWRRRIKPRRIDLIPLGIFGAVFVGLLARSLASVSEVTNVAKRFVSIFRPGDYLMGSGRIEIWRAATESIKERPLLGWGPDTFGLVSTRFETTGWRQFAPSSVIADNAHNYPLHLAAGVGVPGVVLFFAIWGWALLKSSKVVFAHRGGSTGLLAATFWAASIGYLVHLIFNISVPGTTFLLWVALAVILAPTARTLDISPRRFGRVATAGIALVAALGIAGQSVVLAADKSYVVAADDYSRLVLYERVAAADRAVSLNPLASNYRSTAAAVRANSVRADVTALAQAEREGEDTTRQVEALSRSLADAESAYREAIDFTPSDCVNYVNLAAVYNLAGNNLDSQYYYLAIETVESGLEVMPLSTDLREKLADALIGLGQLDEAIATLEYCIQLVPNHLRISLLLAKLYQEDGLTYRALLLLESVRVSYKDPPYVLDAAIRALEEGRTLP